MKIFNKFEIVEPYPALYIPELKVLIISDLHLGLEGIMNHSSRFMPKLQFKEIIEDLKEILKIKDVEEVIINGDLKHQFSRSSRSEWKEVNVLLNFLKNKVRSTSLIKGNHDNRLIYFMKKYQIPLKDYLIRDDILITHGHRDFGISKNVEYIVIGHDHPILSLRNDASMEKRIQCFIYGECRGKKVIMLPAFSKLNIGSRINRQDRLYSPILRGCDMGEFKAVGVDKEEDLTLEFSKIKEIQSDFKYYPFHHREI